MTQVAWQDVARLLSDDEVACAVTAAAAHGGRAGLACTVVFVSDGFLTDMHARHLDDPTPTDVITFDLGQDGDGPAGELYVSVDRARDQARVHGNELEHELLLYVVHGVLHLCGFDDREHVERMRMRAAERSVLHALGLEGDAIAPES